MTSPALIIDGVGKRYRIGRTRGQYRTLRDTVADAARSPLRAASALLRAAAGGFHERTEPSLWALKDVSLEIGPGEAVGIIGRNGAGKTTLLKLISRITDPTEGEIRIWGRVRSLLEAGTGFHPDLTGRENVYLNGAILGMRSAEVAGKFDEIVAFAEVETFIDTPVKHYSSGMYVRLAFAVAAHLKSEIMLIDEVLAVGDVAFQSKCLGKMEEVSQSGRTVIVVSHNMPTITRFCSRVILLDEGRVAADGRAEDVVARYLAPEAGGGAERRWPELESAPGNDCVRLRAVRVVDQERRTTDRVDVRRTAGVQVTFDILAQTQRFVPSVALTNEYGAAVFLTIDTAARWSDPQPPGRYVSTVWIPPHLLNEGRMVVTVALGTFVSGGKAIKQAYALDVVAFQVVDPGEGDTARGEYADTWAAPIRPLLNWTSRVGPLVPDDGGPISREPAQL